MLRRIAAVFFGFFISSFVFMVLQSLVSREFPPPDGFNYADKEALALYWRSLPNKMFVWVTCAHAVSGFIGGLITALISDKYKTYMGMLVGGILVASALTYMSVVLVPTWMIVVDPLAIFIFAYMGAKIGSSIKK